MAIPNTTPTPNELYNGEMKKMNDTELRVVLIVTRATLGWEIDHETGMRKQEDWISHNQMIQKSGKSSRAISYAIKSCVQKGWIETRDKEGHLLITSQERKKYGRKIFYRLGRIFLDKVTTATDAKVTTAINDIEPLQQLRTTKETLTKENTVCHTQISNEEKKALKKEVYEQSIAFIDYYVLSWTKITKEKPIVSYGKYIKRVQWLIKQLGLEEMKRRLNAFFLFDDVYLRENKYPLSNFLSDNTINKLK